MRTKASRPITQSLITHESSSSSCRSFAPPVLPLSFFYFFSLRLLPSITAHSISSDCFVCKRRDDELNFKVSQLFSPTFRLALALACYSCRLALACGGNFPRALALCMFVCDAKKLPATKIRYPTETYFRCAEIVFVGPQ